ncbi:hypothetical protein T12_4930 [Trichinella patagoniensis]|uniref:Uncharacterized protein n=1 Tax=Trichinella patagoniensis TaxID=990121 RepID=A0A0V0ZN35_9BILA|nr:hypothetical protein T12_4930 [Trichinella patagoniensis]
MQSMDISMMQHALMQKCDCCVKLETEMHALLLLHCFLVPRPVIQRFVMAEHADLKFSSLLIMYDERHSTTWISTISIYAFITWEWKEEEYFIHCIVMEARTCSTMILLFNINCHYERYDFTFNIHMSDKQEWHPLQFHTRTFIIEQRNKNNSHDLNTAYTCDRYQQALLQHRFLITSKEN